MGWEYAALKDRAEPLAICPCCLAMPFRTFLRGTVVRPWRKFFRMAYCCVICEQCKEIVDYERP